MPRRKGAGEGKWKSKKTGKFVSSHYAKRNPANVERVEDSVADAERETEPMNLQKRLDQDVLPGLGYEDIYLLGWNDCADYFDEGLERLGKVRAELETRIQNLIETAHHYQCQYSDEVSHRLEHAQRIEQLTEALERIAGSYKSMTPLEQLIGGGPSTRRLVNIADRALSDLKKAEEA